MIEILIAEDDEIIANLIKVNLVKAGYSCTCAYKIVDAPFNPSLLLNE